MEKGEIMLQTSSVAFHRASAWQEPVLLHFLSSLCFPLRLHPLATKRAHVTRQAAYKNEITQFQSLQNQTLPLLETLYFSFKILHFGKLWEIHAENRFKLVIRRECIRNLSQRLIFTLPQNTNTMTHLICTNGSNHKGFQKQNICKKNKVFVAMRQEEKPQQDRFL